MEGLADEIRAGETAVDPAGFSAFLGDGSDAGMTLQVGGRGPAGAVGAQSGQEAGCVDSAGARETFKQSVVGVSTARSLTDDPAIVQVLSLAVQAEAAQLRCPCHPCRGRKGSRNGQAACQVAWFRVSWWSSLGRLTALSET